MAESGGVSGILGAYSESPAEGSISETPTPLDPTAAALAAEAAKGNSGLAEKASAYFDKQSRLVDIQTEHLHEQRAVNLQLLKLKRFAERLRVGLQVFVILVATGIGVALVRIVWSAVDDQHLVIEAFSVPPDLGARGINGQVMAAQVLDRLGQINAQANSSRAPSSYAANWGEQVKLEIPETGISIGELQRFFRDWLGHETHVSGEVIRTSGDLSLTVRAGEAPGRTVSAPESDLTALTQQAAEAAFAITQPYRYTVYLDTTGRSAQALQIARALTREGTAHERAWAWAQVSNLLMESGDAAGAARAAETSIKLDPRIPIAHVNASNAVYMLGDEERYLQYSRKVLELLDSDSPETTPNVRRLLRAIAQSTISLELGAFEQTAGEAAALETGRIYGEVPNPEMLTSEDFTRNFEAYLFALGHDVSASLRIVADHPVSDADALTDLAYTNDAYVTVYERAIAVEDWAQAAADMRDTIAAAPLWQAFAPIVIPFFLQPRLAYALARGGQQVEAERIAAALPTNCYRCARTRGWVATMAQDWPRADREFAEAVRQGPSLPTAYLDWGASLRDRGDLDGAIAKFAAAHGRGPQFADPLKAWGDILVKQGKTKQALAKYDEALKYAPNWKQLKEAREAAAKLKS